jgi:hypothetical protein
MMSVYLRIPQGEDEQEEDADVADFEQLEKTGKENGGLG